MHKNAYNRSEPRTNRHITNAPFPIQNGARRGTNATHITLRQFNESESAKKAEKKAKRTRSRAYRERNSSTTSSWAVLWFVFPADPHTKVGRPPRLSFPSVYLFIFQNIDNV